MAPMLDDRVTEYDEGLLPLLTLSYKDKNTSWTAYVGREAAGTDLVPPYAAPARETGLENLPSTYIDGGPAGCVCDRRHKLCNTACGCWCEHGVPSVSRRSTFF